MNDRAILITGASRGIGAACAVQLAKHGFDIGVNFNNNPEGANDVVGRIRTLGRKAISIKADVSVGEEVKAMVQTFTNEFTDVFGLVNNAGVYNRVEFTDLTLAQWEDTLRTNLTSVFMLTSELLPNIISGGRIVNISSILAHRGSDYGAHYATSKAGLLGFTKSLARELAKKNITVNAVAPGPIDTQILAGDSQDRRRLREAEVPLGRIGQPEEIAAAVAFLFSPEATYITGETLNVNGGLLMP